MFSFLKYSTICEAVSVKKQNYSWGKMITVHHGSDTSYPLHPEHQAKIKSLKDGEKTSFKDETKRTVTAHREGDKVHLSGAGTSKKTTVAHSQFTEEAEQMDEESLTAGKRLISKHGEGSHTARVYKDTEYNEYQVHHYKDGKHMGEGPISYHNDKEDAENTAKMHLKKLKEATSAYARIDARFKKLSGRSMGAAAKEYGDEAKRLQKEIDAQKAENERRRAAMKKEEVEIIEVSKELLSRYKEKTAEVNETKSAPKGFHFTRDGKLKRGDADVDGDGGKKLRSDPLDKTRNKIPSVSEENINEATPTSHQVKQAIGIARDKRYAQGNVTGAVKAMDKLNKGLAQHPAVKKELQKQNEEKGKDDLPFTPDEPKNPSAKAGKYGLGYSTAKHLARMALAQQTKKKQDKIS